MLASASKANTTSRARGTCQQFSERATRVYMCVCVCTSDLPLSMRTGEGSLETPRFASWQQLSACASSLRGQPDHVLPLRFDDDARYHAFAIALRFLNNSDTLLDGLCICVYERERGRGKALERKARTFPA